MSDWAPPRHPLTTDVIRRAAELIEARELALTAPHPLYPADGLSVPAALRLACDELGGWYPHVEAVVILHMNGYAGDVEPGTTTDAAVAALREAADAWQATPDHAEQLVTIPRDRRCAVLTDGVTAWVREWASRSGVTVDIVPGAVTWPFAEGEGAPSVNGGYARVRRADGLRVTYVEWPALVATADRHDADEARARVWALLSAAVDRIAGAR